MKRLLDFIALVTIPYSITLNITTILQYKDIVSFVFTIVISIIALISGIFACKHWIIKRKIAEIELQQKFLEYQEKKEEHDIIQKKQPKK